jgi:hypothetical protein
VGGTIVSWISKTQQIVALLSCEAEYILLASGAQEVKFLQMLLSRIMYREQPGILLEDNTGANLLLKNLHVGQRTKHIDDICWYFIRGWGNKDCIFLFYATMSVCMACLPVAQTALD